MLDSLDSIQPPHSPKPRPKRKFKTRLWFGLLLLLLLAGGIFLGQKLVIFAQKILEGKQTTLSFKQFFIASDKKLLGEEQGEIRFLLMGIAGERHDGPKLTDTMIFATLKLPEERDEELKLNLVSIPRDLMVNIPGYEYRKINSAYAYGGTNLALKTVEEVIDQKIPYYAVIDFEGFKKIIDDVGGVVIDVRESFTDHQFPDDKGSYLDPPLTFEAGHQKMGGERTLQFVRSRHGNNNQGSDFARSRRQQLVLKALRDKLTTFRVLTNLGLLDRILTDLGDHLRTNLQLYELKRLYDLGKNLKSENISSLAISGEFGLVCDQIAEDTGAYLLLPCAGLNNYQAIRDLLKNQFLISKLAEEKAIIEIQNASTVSALGQRTALALALPGLTILSSNFKGQARYDETIIYDNTGGGKLQTLRYLQGKLEVRTAQSPFPFPTSSQSPDFVIILSDDLEGKVL